MTPETISNMKIKTITDENSVCFLWITVPLLPHGFDILEKWGFEYKTSIFWYKVDPSTRRGRLGLGHYFRGMVETCLVGVRGNVKPFACQSPNVIIEAPREHSRKPEAFWDLVNNALRDKDLEPRIELFCRGEPRIDEGFSRLFSFEKTIEYDGWGNQCTGKRKVELDLL
jgi:mRNA (2'-O-methyladenosine-N6-)-methyltransferase